MRTTFFLFAMLASMVANAQSSVNVTPVSIDYAQSIVKFNVSWANSSRTGTHNSKVWVWVDYREVTGNAPSGNWARATISGTPTATSGTPSRETGIDKGFWLQGTSGSSGSYNATVTVTLSNVPAKFNWCAYVSDYPPNAEITRGTATNGTYTLHGTYPFTINGTYTTSASSYTGTLITSITDKTDCPGIIIIPQYASTFTGCSVWIELVNITTNYLYPGATDAVCTARYGSEWRLPLPDEIICICSSNVRLENPITTIYITEWGRYDYLYWSTSHARLNSKSGGNCTVDYCNWTGCGGRIRCVRSM
jgi:hypothetical protein